MRRKGFRDRIWPRAAVSEVRSETGNPSETAKFFGADGPAFGVCHGLAGGGGGIRTRDTVSRIHTFQACAFNHSATPPVARTIFMAAQKAIGGVGKFLLFLPTVGISAAGGPFRWKAVARLIHPLPPCYCGARHTASVPGPDQRSTERWLSG